MRKKFVVTEKNLAKGERGDSLYCPIARSIRPNIEGDVSVLDDRVIIYFAGDDLEFKLPLKAIESLKRFDKGLTVLPFSFFLDLPEKIIR